MRSLTLSIAALLAMNSFAQACHPLAGRQSVAVAPVASYAVYSVPTAVVSAPLAHPLTVTTTTAAYADTAPVFVPARRTPIRNWLFGR